MQEQSKLCPACNTQNYANGMYCYACSFKFPGVEPSRRPMKPVSSFAIIFLVFFGCLILSWVITLFRGDKTATIQTAEATPYGHDKSAARAQLENKIHTQAIIMMGLEDTTVITSNNILLVKIPNLTQRDALLEADNYRLIMRAWMRVLKEDFATAGVTNVCVYKSAWSGPQICADPAGEDR